MGISISRKTQKTSRGSVSLFIVVFAALLMTIVTVAFITLMVTNQQNSTSDDLSKSALDSAQAGVEDAKRAILQYEALCSGSTSATCLTIQNNMAKCNQVFGAPLNVTGTSSANAVQVGGSADSAYNQAYTCVKIILNTPDYLGTLTADGSAIVPISGVSSFNTIQLNWYNTVDLQSTTGTSVSLTGPSPTPPLLAQSKWPLNRPSIMRTQLMQFSGSGFRLTDFDENSGGQTDASTVFLYPVGSTGVGSTASTTVSLLTARKTSLASTGVTPTNVTCSGTLSAGGYACSAKLTLPSAINGNSVTFLRLTSLYNATHFELRLLNGGTSVDLNGIQPEIDSTGRADNLYRRIVTRVIVGDDTFPYPDAAVESVGSLCKDFVVTNVTPATTNCTP